jgi:hypothetical protein
MTTPPAVSRSLSINKEKHHQPGGYLPDGCATPERAGTDQKRCFFISLPALLWDANMTPHRGDEGEARECVCS